MRCPLNLRQFCTIIFMCVVAQPKGTNMERFLREYYRQLHFNSMPAEVRARFFDWVRNDTLTDDMRNWVRDRLQHNPNTHQLVTDANGNYIPNALPNPNNNAVLPDAEARRLFIAFQQAFSGMAANEGSLDQQSRDFLRLYFGPNRLFQTSHATPACEHGIDAIVNLFDIQNDNVGNNLKDYIVTNAHGADGKQIFNSVAELDTLLTQCRNHEHNTNSNVQSRIQRVARTLRGAIGWNSASDSNSAEYQAIANIQNEIGDVISNDAFVANVNQNALQEFRDIYAGAAYSPGTSSGLLQTLYFNKTIREQFAKYDNGVITNQITGAENNANWQDKSKGNYVEPLAEDQLTPLQRLQEWVTDTYNDTFRKYEELRGATNLFRQEAKDIFKAIDKEKIKPVDGLPALLEKKDKIEKNINNPVAREHFKWFTEVMGPIAQSMPYAVKGAWKDARQMQAIISQIILRATDPANNDPHAIEKAQTAMEIMTAMRYGMATSKIMDSIKKDKDLFKIFSNEKLSWNKNEGMKFVTGALDKTVRAAFLGVGYAVTIVHNKVKLSGRKYRDRDNQHGALAERFNQENATQQTLRNQNAIDRPILAQNQQTLQNLNTGPDAINAQNVNNMENVRLRTLQQQWQGRGGAQEARNQAQQDFDQISAQTQDARNRLQAEANWTNQHQTLHNTIVQEFRTINNLRRQIAALPAGPVGDARRDILQEQLREHIRTFDERSQELVNIDNVHNAYTNAQQTADRAQEQQYTNAQNRLSAAQTAENTARQQYEDLRNRIRQYRTAAHEVEELTRAIDRREHALQNWPESNLNRVVALENYWNFLQDNTTSWSLFQHRAQARFDRRKHAMLQNYVAQHGMNA